MQSPRQLHLRKSLRVHAGACPRSLCFSSACSACVRPRVFVSPDGNPLVGSRAEIHLSFCLEPFKVFYQQQADCRCHTNEYRHTCPHRAPYKNPTVAMQQSTEESAARRGGHYLSVTIGDFIHTPAMWKTKMASVAVFISCRIAFFAKLLVSHSNLTHTESDVQR